MFLSQSQIQSCERCSRLLSPDGTVMKHIVAEPSEDIDPRLKKAENMIRELELELAQKKLALVESECKTQDLTHQLNAALAEVQSSKNTWFQKTLNSIKDVTTTKGPLREGGALSRKDST